jgi:hypothetical protein
VPEWTPEDVRKVLMNPVNAMGPKPAVFREQWITAQCKLVGELGKRQYFAALFGIIDETFGQFVAGPDQPHDDDDGETNGPAPSSN